MTKKSTHTFHDLQYFFSDLNSFKPDERNGNELDSFYFICSHRIIKLFIKIYPKKKKTLNYQHHLKATIAEKPTIR